MVSLRDVYKDDVVKNAQIVYEALKERQSFESISHKGMPTYKEHLEFINRVPYRGWYIIYNEFTSPVGSIYVSYANEIGIHIFLKFRKLGYAGQAIHRIMEMHPAKYYLANINPDNEKSIKLFNKIGFKHIQNTYKLELKS